MNRALRGRAIDSPGSRSCVAKERRGGKYWCFRYLLLVISLHLLLVKGTCAWGIDNCGHNPLLYSFLVSFGMRDLILLFVHVLATSSRLVRPGGVRSVLAESVLLKHQLLILNRSHRRAPIFGDRTG